MPVFMLMVGGWIAGDLFFWWAADRRLRNFQPRWLWRPLLAAFMVIQVSYMLTIVFAPLLEHLPESNLLLWPIIAYVWHLLVLPVAILALALSALTGLIVRWLPRRQARPQVTAPIIPEGAALKLTRRQALRGAAAILPPMAAIGITGRSAFDLHHFRIRRVELRLPTLPADLDGLTIAHLTDLHVGKFLPPGMAERIAEATNALEVDLVAFTGDLIDMSARRVKPGIDFLRRISPRSGLAIIEGNHDVMIDADRFEGEVLDAHLPLLLDQTITFRVPGRRTPIQFLGISWGESMSGRDLGRTGKEAGLRFRMPGDEARATSIKTVIAQRQPDAFPILLCHHPHGFDPATTAGLPLVLAGHTHGGQIMLTDRIGAGPYRYRYWTGLYRKDHSQLFVSNGLGNWFPVRLNAPAEIVHLTLRTEGACQPP